jgi:two-component system OmpR family response regulator
VDWTVGVQEPQQEQNRVSVLVADDDPYLADLLATGLRFVGHDVEIATDGHDAIVKATDHRPDVIVLDVMMPVYDGFEVCRRLRADGIDTPIMFLTAKDAVADKVGGLGLGGDDYLTKPFSLEEVVARVEALARRTRTSHRATTVLSCGDVTLDQDTHQVHRAGVPVELTATEFNVLRFLLLNTGRVVSKEQIFEHVWGFELPEGSTVVETYVSYIRKKLDARSGTVIRTVRGAGYIMNPSELP